MASGDIRLTQETVEVATLVPVNVRLTQETVEVATLVPVNVRLTQETVEVATLTPVNVRLTQETIEVATLVLPNVRLTQETIEVAFLEPVQARITQVAAEAFYQPDTFARISQLVREVIIAPGHCPLFPAVNPPTPPDFAVFVYDSCGDRKYIPPDAEVAIDFFLSERGGYESGTLRIVMDWQPSNWTGEEFVDVYLWGQRMFRGWARVSRNSLSTPESVTLNLYGLVSILEKYKIRRHFCYATDARAEDIFTSIVNIYVQKSDRLPGVEIDVTGVAALNLTTKDFDAKGKSVPQAFNTLCDLFPGVLIWGADVNPANGQNRLYLRPRATEIGYGYAVGGNISAFVYPVNSLPIVNRLYITGGALEAGANLAINGSFEDCVTPGKDTSNILRNPGFEEQGGDDQEPSVWQWYGDPRRHYGTGFSEGDAAHNGSAWMELDNYDAGTEAVYQQVSIAALARVHASIYARQMQVGGGKSFHITIFVQDSSFVNLDSYDSGPLFPNNNGNYDYFEIAHDFGSVPGAAYLSFQAEAGLTSSHGNGVFLDDAAMWQEIVTLEGWTTGLSVDARYTTLDWFASDAGLPYYHGDNAIKVEPVILALLGYVEITATEKGRVSVRHNTTYTLRVYARSVGGGPSVQIGVRRYAGDVLQDTILGDTLVLPSDGTWYPIYLRNLRTDSETTQIEPFFRFHVAAAVWIDAFGVYEGDAPTGYTESDKFEGIRTVRNYGVSDIGEAVNSIAEHGEQEAEISNDSITDTATMDAYAKRYFAVNAVPAIEGELTIKDAQEPLLFDGKVKLVNLPDAPSTLVPVRLHYTITEEITIEADLNNERPTLDLLLRSLQEKRI